MAGSTVVFTNISHIRYAEKQNLSRDKKIKIKEKESVRMLQHLDTLIITHFSISRENV